MQNWQANQPLRAAASIKMKAFDLDDESGYRFYRDQKLAGYPQTAGELIVEVRNPASMTEAELAKITALCRKTNMAIYSTPQDSETKGAVTKEEMIRVVARFGLNRLDKHLCADGDGVSALCHDSGAQKQEYIPYSRRAINWHTDGYYNPPGQKIRAMLLHCSSPAEDGGENELLDHEIVYILLRDQNPDYIAALMQQDVMTIPANIQQGEEIRPALTGPVFSIDSQSGDLHMRYTARTRSIEWKQDALTLQAVAALTDILQSPIPYKFRHGLTGGQGVITNNVLHTRTAFEDDELAGKQRLVYRVRSYDRIQGTSIND